MSDSASKKAKPTKPVLGYWKIRGLVSPIVYVLEYCGVDYETVWYEQADDLSIETWRNAKFTLGLDFPNLPYWFHGDLKLTESQAIMRYICNTWQPDLLGKSTRDKAIVDMFVMTLSDVKSPITTICYASGDRAEATKQILERAAKIETFMKDRDFVAGDYVTFADFFLFEQEELFEFISEGKFFKHFPALASHHSKIVALPKFAEFLNSDRFVKRPFNNKSAKLNN